MGLDMYLTAKKYMDSEFGQNKELDRKIETYIQENMDTNAMQLQYLEYRAMCWRKANAIHAWFVDNVQDGKDDCGTYYVDGETLETLRDACLMILEKPELANTLLPTQSGFFFGSTDYDEYYMEDLQITADGLTKLLKWAHENPRWSFYYHSSW